MVDLIVDASERRGRVDIRTGVGHRRRWGGEDKGRFVADGSPSHLAAHGLGAASAVVAALAHTTYRTIPPAKKFPIDPGIAGFRK
jgi:hypothetical protein